MALTLFVEPLYISPYVFACFVTLKEKGLAFSMETLDTDKGQTRAADYLDRTITGRVPSLLHDDFGIAESSAIVEYLDEAFPAPSVLPKALHARARCRQLMSWLRSDDTAPIREERPTSTMFYAPSDGPLSAKARAASEKLVTVTARLIAPGRPSLFDEWCIADAELAFMLHRLILNDDAVPTPVRVWAEAQWTRPSVKAWCDLPRKAG